MLTTSSLLSLELDEVDIVRLILEFLDKRQLHIAQLSLERETGVVNGHFLEDVLFLRQLILCGQWDNAREFVEPLRDVEGFEADRFRFLIAKYKYFELLCIKQEPGPTHDHDTAVEEIVDCLRELERVCPSAEEFHELCALLTLPKLTDHRDFGAWNPSAARVECFHAVFPLIRGFIGGGGSGRGENPSRKISTVSSIGEFDGVGSEKEKESKNDRLVQLVVKGLLYESAMDFCQQKALYGKDAPKGKRYHPHVIPPAPPSLATSASSLSSISQQPRQPKLSSADLSLISWLEALDDDQFTAPFQQPILDLKIQQLKKPKLEAKGGWGEHILAAPIQPDRLFPYSLVSHSKFKCVQRASAAALSQSMFVGAMPSAGGSLTGGGEIFGGGGESGGLETHHVQGGVSRAGGRGGPFGRFLYNNNRNSGAPPLMSYSTMPAIGGGFSIQTGSPSALEKGAMEQSMIISDMLGGSGGCGTEKGASSVVEQPAPHGTPVAAPPSHHHQFPGSPSMPNIGGTVPMERQHGVQRSKSKESADGRSRSRSKSPTAPSTEKMSGGQMIAGPDNPPVNVRLRARPQSLIAAASGGGAGGSFDGGVGARHSLQLLQPVPEGQTPTAQSELGEGEEDPQGLLHLEMQRLSLQQQYQQQQGAAGSGYLSQMPQQAPFAASGGGGGYFPTAAFHHQNPHHHLPTTMNPYQQLQPQQFYPNSHPRGYYPPPQPPDAFTYYQSQSHHTSIAAAAHNPPYFNGGGTATTGGGGGYYGGGSYIGLGTTNVGQQQWHQPLAPPPPQNQQQIEAAIRGHRVDPSHHHHPRAQHHQIGTAAAVEGGDGGGEAEIAARFVAVCRYTDQQAIRTSAFHPGGRLFVLGTNSKALVFCKYPPSLLHHQGGNLGGAAVVESPLELPRDAEVLITRPKFHRGSIYCVGFNGDGTLVASGSNDKSLKLLRLTHQPSSANGENNNGDELELGAELDLSPHDGTVRDLIFMDSALHGGHEILVSGGAGNCHICVTDCANAQTFRGFPGHTAAVLGLFNWKSSTTNFVSCSADRSVRFWDLRVSGAVNVVLPGDSQQNLTGGGGNWWNSSPVTSVCVDPTGKLLVSGHEDSTVSLFDIVGNRPVQRFRPHNNEVRSVRLSNGAFYLLSGGFDRRVVITDMRGNLAGPLAHVPVAEHRDRVIQCRWHPSDFTFLSTSADRTATIWALPQQLQMGGGGGRGQQ